VKLPQYRHDEDANGISPSLPTAESSDTIDKRALFPSTALGKEACDY